MIGISQLDRLSTENMYKIINGDMKIKVRDPRKIQTSILTTIEPQSDSDIFLNDFTVETLLKMEIESRLGWHYLRKKIMEIDRLNV